jgi:competence protein ComEC
MAVVYLGLRAFDLRTAPVNALGIGASLMLLANPLDVVNAGFWLTFGATGALLAAGARWQLKRPTRRWHAAAAICMASLAVEVVLTPVSAFVFQRVTVAGLILNLPAVPAMGVVQGAASACVLFDASGLAAAADAAGRVTHWGARVLVDSSRLVDLAPWATWRVPAPASWAMATYYVSLLGWWLALRNTSRHRRVLIRACGTTAAALWLLIATAPQTYVRAALDTQLRLTAFDVGQGDAFLVTFPDGHTLLVDAGGTSASGAFDIGDRVLGPALRARGLGQVDYLAVTHGDLDHIGGAVSLIRDFRVTEVWAGVPVAGHSPERLLRVAADARRTVWRWMQRGDRLHVGAVELRVHHPPVPEWERQRVRNDDSLVLEIRYGDISLLLTGDISRTVESDLLGLVDLRPTVVLKAPHHGSGTSSSMPFLLRLQPRALLVSAGRGNPYGHPTPEVLQRYHAIDASVFRTDHDGQIELATDGYSIEVTTFSGRKWRMR